MHIGFSKRAFVAVPIVLATLVLVIVATLGGPAGRIGAAGTPGELMAPTGGSLPGTGGGYNGTHWKVQAGDTVTGHICAASDVPSGSTTVNVFVKSSDFGNTTLTGTVGPACPEDDAPPADAGPSITFTWTAPIGGCNTTIVAYISNGNNTNNEDIPGNGNASTAGFALVDANGNVITTCATTTTPSLSTQASLTTGGLLTDTAMLSGASSPVSGSITFNLYKNDPTCSGTSVDTEGPVAVSANGSFSTPSGYQVVSGGTYNWTANFVSTSANNNNVGPVGCGDANEQKTVTAGISVTTLLGATGPLALGGSMSDSAKVQQDPTYLPAATGTVTFTLTGPNDSTGACNGSIFSTSGAIPLSGNPGIASVGAQGPLGAGNWGFKAHYDPSAADSATGYLASDSLCEPFVVNKGSLSLSTTLLHAGPLGLGGSNSDSVAITGVNTSFPLGNVASGTSLTLNFFKNNTCSGAAADTTNAIAAASASGLLPEGPLAAGSYAYQAALTLNAADAANYNVTGNNPTACSDETFTVNKGTVGLSTTIYSATSNSPITGTPPRTQVGTAVYDTVTATLTGCAVTCSTLPGSLLPSSVPAFSLWNAGNNTCNGTANGPAQTTTPATGGANWAATAPQFKSGSYTTAGTDVPGISYNASFAGDSNWTGPVSGTCEPLGVYVFGFTMGYWGNTNGLTRNGCPNPSTTSTSAPTDVETLGGASRSVTVNTCAIVAKIFPSTLNACGAGSPLILGETATAKCTLATGLNIGTLNVLVAQTLALAYNIHYVTGFNGQLITALPGCSPTGVGSLSSTSTVNNALTYANSLINGSASGGATTQAQAGAMNTLLGCINQEAS